METKLITFSIAAYNVEKYIDHTLSSFILKDNTLLNLFEVIIVNDGSSDNTAKIAKRYVDKYPDTFILVNKANGGYGSTINTSLELARGKYYKLIDGDDWINTNDLTDFINKLSTATADMIITKYCIFNELSSTKEVVNNGLSYDGKVKSISVLDNNNALPMHSISYRTEILKKQNIKITEKCFYTDVEYILKPIPYVNTVQMFNNCIYMYRIGREGQSVSIKSWQKNFDMALKVTYGLIDFYSSIENNGKITDFKKKYIFNRVVDTAIGKYRILLSFKPSKEHKEILLLLDNKIFILNSSIYDGCNKNRIIKILRKSKFMLYKMLSSLYRLHLKNTNQL